MAFAIEICRRAGLNEQALALWFGGRSEAARRARLHGWRLWYSYCVENNLSADRLLQIPQPAVLVANFIVAMDAQGVKAYRIREAKVAVVELMEMLFPALFASLQSSGLIKSMMTAVSSKTRRTARYHDIWSLHVLLDHIKAGPKAETLGGSDLMARAAALFMVFIPCRPVAMLRMDVDRAVWRAEEQILVVPSREKTDKGRGSTELAIRQMKDEQLCPLHAFRLLRQRAQRLGSGSCLFCSDDGSPYKQTSSISKLLRQLMTAAGIPERFVAYSIRHALITALFNAGLGEEEVNAYTGHSQNAHTASTSYFHLNSQWIGHALASTAQIARIPPLAAGSIERDDDTHQREEMDEHEESESDIPQ